MKKKKNKAEGKVAEEERERGVAVVQLSSLG